MFHSIVPFHIPVHIPVQQLEAPHALQTKTENLQTSDDFKHIKYDI